MSEPIQSIAQNNYILHNIDAKKLYVQEPLFTANSGDAVYVGWRPDETVIFSGNRNITATGQLNTTEAPSAFEKIEIWSRSYPDNYVDTLAVSFDTNTSAVKIPFCSVGINDAVGAIRFNISRIEMNSNGFNIIRQQEKDICFGMKI